MFSRSRQLFLSSLKDYYYIPSRSLATTTTTSTSTNSTSTVTNKLGTTTSTIRINKNTLHKKSFLKDSKRFYISEYGQESFVRPGSQKQTQSSILQSSLPSSFISQDADPVILFRNFRALKQKKDMVKSFKKILSLGKEHVSELDSDALTDAIKAISSTYLKADADKVKSIIKSTLAAVQETNMATRDRFHAAIIMTLGKFSSSPAEALEYIRSIYNEDVEETSSTGKTRSLPLVPPIIMDAIVKAFSYQDKIEAASNLVARYLKRGGQPFPSTFQILIRGFGEVKNIHQAEFYYKMALEKAKDYHLDNTGGDYSVVPSSTHTAMLHAYAAGRYLSKANVFLKSILREDVNDVIKLDPSIWIALLRAYCSTNRTFDAQNIVNHMETNRMHINEQGYAYLMQLYGEVGDISKVVQAFYKLEIHADFKPTLSMWYQYMNAYVKIKDLLSAWKVFHQIWRELHLEERYGPSRVVQAMLAISKNDLTLELARHHINKHPDYLRDLLKFSGCAVPIEGVFAVLMKSLVSSGEYSDIQGVMNLYEQYTSPTFQPLLKASTAATGSHHHAGSSQWVSVYAMKAFATAKQPEKAKALFKEAVKTDATEAYTSLLLCSASEKEAWEIWDTMKSNNIEPSMDTYEVLFRKIKKQDGPRFVHAVQNAVRDGIPSRKHTETLKLVQSMNLEWSYTKLL